jgi:rhomboid protease GluP
VLDLNRILLFVALLSPTVILLRTARRAALNRSWRAAAAAVLVITTAAIWIAPAYAGFVGAVLWLLLLVLPVIGVRRGFELAAQHRYASARQIMALTGLLHPAPALADQHTIMAALEAASKGDRDTALKLLDRLSRRQSRFALQAVAQTYRIRGDWEGLLAFCREHVPLVSAGTDPALLPLYFRALGETGAIDDLVLQFAGRAPILQEAPEHQSTLDACLMLVLAFCGRTAALRRLFAARLDTLHPDVQEFWLGTSELASAERTSGRTRLERLRTSTDNALLRADIVQRLSAPGRLLPPLVTAATEATLQRLERNVDARPVSILAPRRGVSPAVVTFIALNAGMFALEIAGGGSMNTDALHRLGALEPFAVLARGEYWRLLTALFLHFGSLHLLINCYALYVLGPPLERSLGSLRFASAYLLAGLGSSAGVVALWQLQWTQADMLVGASGSVMGIVGAWAGYLMRNHRAPGARRRLSSIALIVAIQSAFDLYTPQVSMGAHLCGLATGVFLGLVLTPAERDER